MTFGEQPRGREAGDTRTDDRYFKASFLIGRSSFGHGVLLVTHKVFAHMQEQLRGTGLMSFMGRNVFVFSRCLKPVSAHSRICCTHRGIECSQVEW